jgi:hypothetical protein
LSDELPADLRPVVDFFGLPNTAVVAKDFHVVRAIRALAALDAERIMMHGPRPSFDDALGTVQTLAELLCAEDGG